MYKQGQKCDRVFIIVDGEFEQVVKLNKDKKDECPVGALTGP